MKLRYGIVEDIQDPKKLGRVRVRVFGIHNKDKNEIPTADLPWSLVMGGTTTPGISGLGHSSFLIQGGWVVGSFVDNAGQDFLVMGSLPTMSSSEQDPSSFGFTDPKGQYPRASEEEDNNLRARGRPDPNDYEVQGTYQPRSAYAPQYPYNHIYESESGHIKEYDDTPGSARIRERHNSGTYYEVQPGGSKIERVVADNYELILGDDTIEVKGNVNIIVSEDVNLSCAGNVTANVGNNVDFLVNGDVNGEVRGNIAMRVGANLDDHITDGEDGVKIHTPSNTTGLSETDAIMFFETAYPDIYQRDLMSKIGSEWVLVDKDGNVIDVTPARNGNIDLHIEGNLTGLVDGHVNMTVLQSAKIDIKKDADIDVGGNTTLDVVGNMDTNVGGTYKVHSVGKMFLDSDDHIYIA